ncbi:hypothetical protein evm_013650 [Chilo suppressalis]|nr:hypothetical protein evm_013650 [Chilo suppressalis]
MEHIRQYDWCATEPDVNFLSESDIDNSVTEKILRNKFYDPLAYSESEDDEKSKVTFDWDEIFKNKKNDKKSDMVVQGIHPVPPFTKLSALTGLQHYQCLKVLCSQCPDVLPNMFIPRPTKHDYKVFEQVQEVYKKEQREFIEWAKSLWTSKHCARALRPKPPIEMVYEAEFKVRANSLQSFPKNYTMAAQIPLQPPNTPCDIEHEKDIIKVNVASLPELQYPDMNKRITIMKPCPAPEPCNKHPCHFILPTESAMTILPLTEVHRELAQFALDNGADTIASENALRCLMQDDRDWALPVSVCTAVDTDGESRNVVVFGSEFSINKDSAQMRTYKAFRRLLQYALVPSSEVGSVSKVKQDQGCHKKGKKTEDGGSKQDVCDSDEDDEQLVIDTDNMADESMESIDDKVSEELKSPRRSERIAKDTHNSSNESANKIDFYNCTCKDTRFERPAPRSYSRWRVRNNATREDYRLLVHCVHRARHESSEVVLEPIPEYQIDLGASEQGPDIARSQDLAMMLRRNASVLNVRIDISTGDIVRVDQIRKNYGGSKEDSRESTEISRGSTGTSGDIAGRLWAALDQVRGLLPGHYVLKHEELEAHLFSAFGCDLEVKQLSQWSVIGWVTKLYYLCASEGTLSRWSPLHLQLLAPTNPTCDPAVGTLIF